MYFNSFISTSTLGVKLSSDDAVVKRDKHIYYSVLLSHIVTMNQ